MTYAERILNVHNEFSIVERGNKFILEKFPEIPLSLTHEKITAKPQNDKKIAISWATVAFVLG